MTTTCLRADFLQRGGSFGQELDKQLSKPRKCRDCENTVVGRARLCGPCNQAASKRRDEQARERNLKRYHRIAELEKATPFVTLSNSLHGLQEFWLIAAHRGAA